MSEDKSQEQQLEVSQELDLGLDKPAPIDYESALSKTKPDFQRMAKLLGIKGQGSTQEEVEKDLLAKQQALEVDLKENLVPKVQATIQASLAKASGSNTPSVKPGVTISSPDTQETRKTRPWKGFL